MIRRKHALRLSATRHSLTPAFCCGRRSDTISVEGLMQLASSDPGELKDGKKRESAAVASQPA